MIAKIVSVAVLSLAAAICQAVAWCRRGATARAAAKNIKKAKKFPLPIDHYHEMLAAKNAMIVDEKLNRVIAAIENAFVPDRRETRLTIATIVLAFAAGMVNLLWQ